MFYQLLASKHHSLGDLNSPSLFGRVEPWVWSQTKKIQKKNNNKSRAKQEPRSAHGRAVNLQFLLPNLNRKMLIYWDTATRKCNITDTEKVFEGDDNNQDDNDDDDS